jgi:hypothetical protein
MSIYIRPSPHRGCDHTSLIGGTVEPTLRHIWPMWPIIYDLQIDPQLGPFISPWVGYLTA